MSLLIRACLVDGEEVDVRISDGVISEIGARLSGDIVLDADGGALLPGLHDHHLHLHALAAALTSVPCGPPTVRSAEQLAAALRAAAGPVRGVGYHESVAGPLDRDVLDAMAGDKSVRIQHRSGAAWFLNSAALASVPTADPAVEKDGSGRPTGRVLRGDHLFRTGGFPDLAEVGRLLASYGVTGVTDATPRLTSEALASLRGGSLPQRRLLLGAPLGDTGDGVGPWKILLDEHAGLDLDALVAEVTGSHAVGRPVAMHAVTLAEAVVAVEALTTAGALAGDRIEHGSLLSPDLDSRLRDLGVTVVTQPNFVAERGDDYRVDVDHRDLPLLYRCASLVDSGVGLAAGTDAPYGMADPWALISAAVDRRTESGLVVGQAERISTERALGLLLGEPRAPGGPPRRVEVGAVADLCLLDVPLEEALRRPSAVHVRATAVAGEVVYDRGAGE